MSRHDWQGRQVGLGIDGPILAASLALNVLSLLTPLTILLIFDRVIPFQSFETLAFLTLGLFLAAALEFVLRWTRSTLLNVAAARSAVDNHMRFLEKVVSANLREFAKTPVALHLERYNAIARMRDHYSGQNQALAIDVPFTALFILMVGLIGGWLVLVPMGCLLAVLVFASMMKRAQGLIFNTRKTLDERRYAFLSEVLAKIATVKCNTMERQMARRFELLQDQTVVSSQRLILFSGFAQSFGFTVSQLSIAAMGLFGAFLVIHGAIGIAELAACMMLNGRIIQPLTRLISLWVQAESIAVSQDKLREMDKLKCSPPAARPIQKLRGEVVLRDVVLAGPVDIGLRSARIPVGETRLLDIPYDWGMAAFIDAITGQCPPRSGSIMIDGLPAADRTSERGPSSLVVLEQTSAVFTGTLIDNISAFGDADQVELAKYFAKALGLEKRIFRLPAGYLTQLNTNCLFEKDPVNRQLIALARALAMQPKVLVMNEPTAVLEPPEREALSTCLASLERQPTLLMASPDPRMKRLAKETISITGASDAVAAEWFADAEADIKTARALRMGLA